MSVRTGAYRTAMALTLAVVMGAAVMSAAALLSPGAVWAQQGACVLDPAAQAGMKAASQNCQGCHVFALDKKSRPTGPNLAQVYGAQAGTLDDFKRYSQGMKLLSKKGIVWTEDTLDAYIKDPKPFIESRSGRPGVMHGMFFKLADDEKRAQVIDYLKRLSECYGPRK